MTSPVETVKQPIRCKTVFISDVHLGFKDCRADYLLDFLNTVQAETIYLLGDIVDLWSLSKRFYWPSSHYDVLKKINDLANNGTRVIYIPGNHDETCRDYIGHCWGKVEIHEEFIHETAKGKKFLLIHGDILDHVIRFTRLTKMIGDGAYDLLLFLNRWCNYIRKSFGFSYWSLAAYLKNKVGKARKAIDIYEDAAIKEAKKRGLDGVICGHIHQPEIRAEDGILYCNDGDWIENCTALIEDENGRLELIYWTERRHSIKSVSASNDEVIDTLGDAISAFKNSIA